MPHSTLQSTFQHLLPILNDNPDPDYIPAPVAFSAAVPDDGSNTDQTFRNLLSDASRVLLAGDNLPPPPPEFADQDQSTDSGVVLSALKFHTGRKRGRQFSYNGYIFIVFHGS